MQGNATLPRLAVLCLVGCLAFASQSRATNVTLTDLNSTASFETQTQAGQYSWKVEGVEQLFQQWFWFRIGPNGPEQSLDTLPQTNISVSDNNFNPGNDHLSAQYTGTPVRITTSYDLTGGNPGSGASDLIEQISIQNLTGTVLNISFFQYVDFDLIGTVGNDIVQIIGGNTARQSEGPIVLAETVATTLPTHHEVNFFANTLNSLNDAGPTTLNDSNGPLGPGDVTWAFEWDLSIGPGGTVLISKDKRLQTPEPASLGLLMMGSVLTLRRRRAR